MDVIQFSKMLGYADVDTLIQEMLLNRGIFGLKFQFLKVSDLGGPTKNVLRDIDHPVSVTQTIQLNPFLKPEQSGTQYIQSSGEY